MINARLAGLLSDFCLDVAKASFVGAFISVLPVRDLDILLNKLTLGLLDTIILMYFSYTLLELKNGKELG